jgi:hypothetical protein
VSGMEMVLALVAAMLIGAVGTAWTLVTATRPPRVVRAYPGRHRVTAGPDGFRLAELATPSTMPTVSARAVVLPMPLHRYAWPEQRTQ